VAALDWNRCTKSAYEIECLKTANQIASQGHKAVRACFEADQTATEHSLHLEFLKATQQTESALPYNTIVGLNEKSAMLHYQKKRISYHPPQVLLIDAGVSYKGYASDITRTYAKPTLVHGVFSELLTSLNALQLSLCHATQAEVSFVDLHVQCHQGIAQLLLDQGILRGCSTESALAQGLTSLFLPHGLGHMLGLQVHDVGGTQLNAQGDRCPLHPTYPKLRMNRPLRENEVVTIEPGLYFIPLLLEAKRHTPEAKHIHWPLIEVLYPYGGIRIEDDLWVQSGSRENLTRSYLP
jgi:Xaa-Pro dipeptidase